MSELPNRVDKFVFGRWMDVTIWASAGLAALMTFIATISTSFDVESDNHPIDVAFPETDFAKPEDGCDIWAIEPGKPLPADC